MRLQRLTSLEINKVIEEFNALQISIKELNKILQSHALQNDIIKEELNHLLEKYGDDRRTEIIPFSGDLSVEDMIAEEDMVLTITHKGYIKRLATSQWRTQKRGGRGMKGAHTRADDFVEHLFVASTHDMMLFFTDQGKCYWLKVHQIPQALRTSQGRAIINLIGCEPGEQVQAFLPVHSFDDNQFIIMATQKGIINRTALSLYSKPRKGGVYAMQIKEGDQLIQAKISNGDDTIIMATKGGKSIRFDENQVRPTGRRTTGVRGIRLGPSDKVIGMLIAKREGSVLVASENGYGKRSNLDEYRIQARGGKGVYTMKKTHKTGSVVIILEAIDDDDLMIITNKGVMIRQSVNKIRIIGRNTQGVRLLRLDNDSKISSVTKVIKDSDDTEDQEQCTATDTNPPPSTNED